VNEIKNIEKHLKMKKKTNATQGTRITSDGLKGHVFEVSLCRMNSWSFHKFKLKLSQRLPGMDLIRNKIWQTSQVNIKTTDGYFLLFCLMTCDALTNDLKEVLNKVSYDHAHSVDTRKAHQSLFHKRPPHDFKDLLGTYGCKTSLT
uniref:Uncharacterized protein n=1 Tax=Oreochromis niloticus TaxID=8128 RepID=A0A669EIC7_ORENI